MKLGEILEGKDLIVKQYEYVRRQSVLFSIVFKRDDKFYSFAWDQSAIKYQDGQEQLHIDHEGMIGCREVEPYEKTMYRVKK